jgi:hypothetical protein
LDAIYLAAKPETNSTARAESCGAYLYVLLRPSLQRFTTQGLFNRRCGALSPCVATRKPSPQRPKIIIARVEGSGTADSPGTIDCARSNIIAPFGTTRKAAEDS